MTHDPFQTYATLGAYSGIGNPFQTPFNALQSSWINPAAAWNPLNVYQQQQPGYSGVQYNPQAANLQNPLAFGGVQHGLHQNPILQQLAAQQLAHQILAQQLAAQQIAAQQIAAQQGGLYPQVGQIGFGGQQGISPFGQGGSPFGQAGMQLAPQSWVGQAAQLAGGQTNPILLAQLTARALQAQGINPMAGFQG